uniref:Uncharacterized protein n=1 Tax=Arundo donax TaxID=35708 RepID=A0A0A9F4N7_ARUDO
MVLDFTIKQVLLYTVHFGKRAFVKCSIQH